MSGRYGCRTWLLLVLTVRPMKEVVIGIRLLLKSSAIGGKSSVQ